MTTSTDTDVRAAQARAASQSDPAQPVIPPMRADDHSNADPAVETPVEARQGFLGRPVLAVLIGGLILAGIAWVIVHYAA